MPYRMAFAGGWIDQPFVSRLNPTPPGSMVVVALEPTCRFMDRCGMGTGTRKVAAAALGRRAARGAIRRSWCASSTPAENRGKAEPSGSQDMIGLIYPGVNRLDYDFAHEGGYFPAHIESNNDPAVARWLEEVIHMLPVAQRPAGYNPLGIKNLDPAWIRRLGQSGEDCYDAILAQRCAGLGDVDERVHALLGGDPARHGPPSDDHGRPGRAAGLLPVPLSRRDVLRLRRRLSVRRLGRAGAGRLPGQGQTE